MRNQRALAAACAAVAVLGFAAPVAVADGMGNGNGGGALSNDRGFDPGNNGISGNADIRGHDDDSGSSFGDRRRRDCGCDRGDAGRDPGSGDDVGRGEGNGNGGRADAGDGRGGGDPRIIFATPSVVTNGARLHVTVDGCRGGVMSSRAFPSTQLDPFGDNTSRGAIRVDRDARPGRYDVRVRCDGVTLTRPAAFTVLGGVHGGFGGGTTTGATPADMAIGGVLVGSGVIAGGVFWVRRRNEKRI